MDRLGVLDTSEHEKDNRNNYNRGRSKKNNNYSRFPVPEHLPTLIFVHHLLRLEY